MKTTTMKLCAVLTAGIFAGAFAIAQDKGKPAGTMSMEEMMKKCEEINTPGAAHKALDPLVGEWNTEMTCWMGPGVDPMKSKGTVTSRWVMNNRFVQDEFSGEMMGKPFKGLGLLGYDNMKQKYVNVWIDDMSTAVYSTMGAADASGKVITMEGVMDDPMTGQKNKPTKNVLRIESRDRHVFEMHDPTKGADSKVMEVVYTRKK